MQLYAPVDASVIRGSFLDQWQIGSFPFDADLAGGKSQFSCNVIGDATGTRVTVRPTCVCKLLEDTTLKLDIDSKSHPAWTGGSRHLVDTAGQVAKFNKRFQGLGIKS